MTYSKFLPLRWQSRQQAHVLEMKELQLKARQETTEASIQLEEVRKRAAEAAQNAAQMITMVRGGEASQSLHESRRRLIESQTEAAKATAEATRCLAEARGGVVGNDARRKVKVSVCNEILCWSCTSYSEYSLTYSKEKRGERQTLKKIKKSQMST